MSVKKFVLLGDIVSSRKIQVRNSFQERLDAALGRINTVFAADFNAPLKIIKGLDEFGGVLKTLRNYYRIMAMLGEYLHPQVTRAALIYDKIGFGQDTGDIARMDGPAIHRASSLIDRLKSKQLFFDAMIDNPVIDGALMGQLNLLALLKKGWSERQMLIFREYRETGNQYSVAEKFKITQQAVSSTLKRCMYRQIDSLEKGLNEAFHEYSIQLKC